ncbi:MAG: sulfite exporter TauE/SafE family protein [Chloroflexi bacterium]|nr:sulfite exporter TauE/SafE family protein [Chloroflexota bacterium]
MDVVNYLVVALGMLVAGSINAIAGGGTVFSFTALAWTGMNLIHANATNAAALVPGSLGGAFALRRELAAQRRSFVILLIPTLAGSLVGAFVVSSSSEDTFRRVVPWLVLFATGVFAGRNLIVRMTTGQPAVGMTDPRIGWLSYAAGILMQFVISFYGGYFGAGIGILMLTSLSIMGMHDVLKMNALKNILAVGINGTAAVFFIARGLVDWRFALLGMVCSLTGGYVVARFAKRINQNYLRVGIVVAGVVVSAWMFWRLSN